jgi:hypothetical protein
MLYILISAIVLIILDSVYLNLTGGYFKKQVMAVQGSPLQLNLVGAAFAMCFSFLG